MNNNNTGTVIGAIVVLIIVAGAAWLYQSGGLGQKSQYSVIVPARGQTFYPGSTYMLRWNDVNTVPVDATSTATTTHIFLINTALQSQGQSVSISDRRYDVPDIGAYQYTVPSSLPEGTYKFEIGTLTSDEFEIATSTATP